MKKEEDYLSADYADYADYKESLLQKCLNVIPAKAGIQSFQCVVDPGFRRGDGYREFCKSLKIMKIMKKKEGASRKETRAVEQFSRLGGVFALA